MDGEAEHGGRLARLSALVARPMDWRPIDRMALLCGSLAGLLVLVLLWVFSLPHVSVYPLLDPAAIGRMQLWLVFSALMTGALFIVALRLRRRRERAFWLELTLAELFVVTVVGGFYFTGTYATTGAVVLMLGLLVALPMMDLRAMVYGVWTYLILLPGTFLLETFGIIRHAPIYPRFPRFSDPDLDQYVQIGRVGGTWVLMLAIWMVAAQLFLRWQEREAQFRELSQVDSLTGVMNRRGFFAAYEREWTRARRLEHTLSVLMCDIDHFKDVNDTWGHPAGDEVLRAVARTMGEGLRAEVDLVGRFGGEEFIVLLPETDNEGARIVAERIRERISALKFAPEDGGRFNVTVSLGIATLNGDAGLDREAVIELADQHLYRAKKNGRNRVEGG